MATARRTSGRGVMYPTRDGKPIAESEVHLWTMMDLIRPLAAWYRDDPMVYVGGDLLMYYEEGDPNKRLAPDAFVVKGVPKLPPRDNFLIWEEGKAPDVVIEVTSKTTRKNDPTRKLVLYREVLRVPEYFQFDPTDDYLVPALQGFRLRGGVYRPIRPVGGRLPSVALGLHLERSGTSLRLYDPARAGWLPIPAEETARAEAEAARAEIESARAEAAAARASQAEAEAARLRLEIEELRRRLGGAG